MLGMGGTAAENRNRSRTIAIHIYVYISTLFLPLRNSQAVNYPPRVCCYAPPRSRPPRRCLGTIKPVCNMESVATLISNIIIASIYSTPQRKQTQFNPRQHLLYSIINLAVLSVMQLNRPNLLRGPETPSFSFN